jgi:ADP-heptose:LPS heptosyltransferase
MTTAHPDETTPFVPVKDLFVPRRILICRLSAHGDVLQTFPLLATLKHRYPDVFVGWVVEASAAPLLENHPLVDRLHVLRWKEGQSRQKTLRGVWAKQQALQSTLREIQQTRYNVSMDVQGLLKSASLPFLAQIPVRMGYAETRESAAFFYTHKIPKHQLHNPDIPAMQVFMRFLEHLPEALFASQPLSLPATLYPENLYPLAAVRDPERAVFQQKWQQAFSKNQDPQVPVVAIAPATLWKSKHWPPAHWRALIRYLRAQPIRLVLLGGPSDAALAAEILQESDSSENIYSGEHQPANVINWVGNTSWQELREVFERTHLFIGPDSAPLHMANAVAYSHSHRFPRILGLFGPTAPKRTGPIHRESFSASAVSLQPENSLQGTSFNPLFLHQAITAGVPCQPCFKKKCPLHTDACMNELLPEQVIVHVKQLLAHIQTVLKEGSSPVDAPATTTTAETVL